MGFSFVYVVHSLFIWIITQHIYSVSLASSYFTNPVNHENSVSDSFRHEHMNPPFGVQMSPTRDHHDYIHETNYIEDGKNNLAIEDIPNTEANSYILDDKKGFNVERLHPIGVHKYFSDGKNDLPQMVVSNYVASDNNDFGVESVNVNNYIPDSSNGMGIERFHPTDVNNYPSNDLRLRSVPSLVADSYSFGASGDLRTGSVPSTGINSYIIDASKNSRMGSVPSTGTNSYNIDASPGSVPSIDANSYIIDVGDDSRMGNVPSIDANSYIFGASDVSRMGSVPATGTNSYINGAGDVSTTGSIPSPGTNSYIIGASDVSRMGSVPSTGINSYIIDASSGSVPSIDANSYIVDASDDSRTRSVPSIGTNSYIISASDDSRMASSHSSGINSYIIGASDNLKTGNAPSSGVNSYRIGDSDDSRTGNVPSIGLNNYIISANDGLGMRSLPMTDNYIIDASNVLPQIVASKYVADRNNDLSAEPLPQSHFKEGRHDKIPISQQLLTKRLSTYSPQIIKKYQQPMSDVARMMYRHNPYVMGGQDYHQQQPALHNPYEYKDVANTKKKHKKYDKAHDDVYNPDDDHDHKKKKTKKKKYYKPKPRKKKKVYVPVVIKKRKKKKRKIIAIYKGFYIQGGVQLFGKFKKIKDCKKACEITPNCFAADYNPWLKKCYTHSNTTACANMRTHPKLIHFKKVPCDVVETRRHLILLGARVHGALEQKGIKNLQDCIKKCATAGQGISKNSVMAELLKQICFGIDYDFASHKCYFHTNMDLCPAMVPLVPVPLNTVPGPSNVLILLCPISELTV